MCVFFCSQINLTLSRTSPFKFKIQAKGIKNITTNLLRPGGNTRCNLLKAEIKILNFITIDISDEGA